MVILLDIDGVLDTTPSWRKAEIAEDGFMKLNEKALENLSSLYKKTKASIVITSTHRIRFDENKWKEIFENRGLKIESISKLNDKTEINQLQDRNIEIIEWEKNVGEKLNYVIIDDDLSLNALPENIKHHWVQTKPLIGFDEAALEKALFILGIS